MSRLGDECAKNPWALHPWEERWQRRTPARGQGNISVQKLDAIGEYSNWKSSYNSNLLSSSVLFWSLLIPSFGIVYPLQKIAMFYQTRLMVWKVPVLVGTGTTLIDGYNFYLREWEEIWQGWDTSSCGSRSGCIWYLLFAGYIIRIPDPNPALKYE